MKKLFPLSLVLAAGFSFSCSEKKTPQAEPKPSSSSSGNPITAPVDYLGAAAKAKVAADKTLDVAGVKKAIDLYYAQEGKYPKSLNDLVGPDYLSKIPTPPAGMKFDYNP